MTERSEKLADDMLRLCSPDTSHKRWSELHRRWLRGWLHTLNPRAAYCAGYEIGVRGSLAIIDDIANSASVDRSPEGEKPQALNAKHESAVGEAETPNLHGGIA